MKEKLELPKQETPPLLQIYTTVAKKSSDKIADYRTSIRHTSAYLSTSMTIAYEKGIRDALQILLKELNNEQKT